MEILEKLCYFNRKQAEEVPPQAANVTAGIIAEYNAFIHTKTMETVRHLTGADFVIAAAERDFMHKRCSCHCRGHAHLHGTSAEARSENETARRLLPGGHFGCRRRYISENRCRWHACGCEPERTYAGNLVEVPSSPPDTSWFLRHEAGKAARSHALCSSRLSFLMRFSFLASPYWFGLRIRKSTAQPAYAYFQYASSVREG